MFSKSLYRFGAALLFGAATLTASLGPASAQQAGFALPGLQNYRVIYQTINLPSGPVKVKLLQLPEGAERSAEEVRFPAATTDNILYSTYTDLNADTFLDPLWIFPTVGYDTTLNPPFYLYPGTSEATAVAPNNVSFIHYAEMGAPALLSQLYYFGNLYDVNNFGTGMTGTWAVIFWDGIDINTAPTAANLATTETGGFNGYAFSRTVATSGNNRTATIDSNRMRILDPRGRFGMTMYKTTSTTNPSPATVQWFWYANTANGTNAPWQFTVGTPDAALVSNFTDGSFNQGAANVGGTLNNLLYFRGVNLDNTPATRGTLQGNIRRRGVNVPAPNTPESAPGRYAVTFFQAGTDTVVRTEYLYTQPSYDAAGALTTNYAIQGVPAGTYDVLIEQLPVLGVVNNEIVDDIMRPFESWPFADFVPSFTQGVTITANGTTTLNSRLERFGDIDDGTATGTQDGAVDVFDLSALIIAFDTAEGDPNFIPTADLVGLDAESGPDGFVDVLDLDALIQTFDTGSPEVP